jgi:hypothetical protein
MMPAAEENTLSLLPVADLSPALRREIAVIAASLGVQAETVVAAIGTGGIPVRISFVLQNEIPVIASASGILAEEPVTLLYESTNTIGVLAPSVLSGRDTFPRNLGHLNPVPANQPANLCLARAGLQPIYDHHGVEGVMMRLRSWMRDAMTGGLMADGWEPVPLPPGMSLRGGLLNASVFQELAFEHHAEGGATSGIAAVAEHDDRGQVYILNRVYSAETPPHYSELARAIAGESRLNNPRVGVPWIFVWPGDGAPISEPVFGCWTSYGHMRDALASIGLANRLEQAVGSVLANGCDCKHFPGRKTLVILIGLWRPLPMADNIFGLSANPDARRLEIKAFTLETEITGNLLEDSTQVRVVISNPMPDAKLFRWISGVPPLGTAALIGNGALGSALADHLLRCGIEDLTAIDKDFMMPHNLARHRGEVADVYRPKVNQLEAASISLTADGFQAQIRAYDEDIIKLSDQQLAERLQNATVVIDATAAEPVRIRLTNFNKNNNKQITRAEIYDHGRLGVQFLTGRSGNPDLLELYYLLCGEALTDDAVADWLFREHIDGPGVEGLQFGFGCGSPTARLPNYVVTQHAAAFMPTIVQALSATAAVGMGMNKLDEAFRPAGFRWVEAPEFKRLQPSTAADWTVSIHPDISTQLATERATALPVETGGYLYGGWDLTLKQIVIVAASGLPPRSTATTTQLTLGAAGHTPFEIRMARRTRGRLRLCGSWHSHPGTSAALSPTDREAMARFRQIDQPRAMPTLLTVVADGIIEAHLEI